MKHVKSAYMQNNHKAGDHKCEECSYRTNIAANYLTHFFKTHTTENFVNKINSLKPVNPAIVYMIAEQNMIMIQENKRMRKDLDYIKQALQPKSTAKKFNCQKCRDLCESPTRIQEHVIEDHCCKYCDMVFASKTEKENHKKYMCVTCEKTFSHNVELNIHTGTYHKDNTKPEQARPVTTKPEKPCPIPQSLEYKCTECSHQEEKEELLIQHIESKHAAILSPAKVARPVPAPRRKNVNVTKHIFMCYKCDNQETSEDNLKRHMESRHTNCNSKAEKHSKFSQLPNWFLIGDSHVNSIKLGMVEKYTKGKLFCKGFAHPKEARAYCSTKNWPNARYPSNNHSEIVPQLMKVRPYTGGVILCPGNDISNLTALDKAKHYDMAEKSALNMLKVAERALEENSTLEKLVLMEYPPRADSEHLAKLSGYSNRVLRDLVDRSRCRAKIVVGSMANLDYTNKDQMVDRFGPTNSHPRYDGVHLRGNKGSQLDTDSIIAGVKAAVDITNKKQEKDFTIPKNNVKHRQFMQSAPVPTKNKFSGLN